MAQPDDMRRTTTPDASNAQRPQNSPSSRSSRTQTSPNYQQLLQGEASSWSPNSSPKLRKNHDHDDHGNHHSKKSVLMKVKEKARKLKKSLSGKKRREGNELHSPYATPPGGVSLDNEKEEPEYFGSPLNESEAAPDTEKHAAKGHPREANTASSKKNNMTNNVEQKKEDRPSTTTGVQSKNQAPSSGSTDTVPKNNAATIADSSPQSTDSKLSGLTISTPGGTETGTRYVNNTESSSEGQENTRSSLQSRDKGVSVKEYLMQKFEPGEDERALSQVITQTISPRRERMREAMNSFLRSEEPPQLTSKISNSELDISPAASSSNRNVGASSSSQSPNLKSSPLTASSIPSHSLESNLSNASNLSLASTSTAASWQNQNPGSSSTASSNLKPDLGSNRSNSSPNPSSSHNDHAHTSANATRVLALISSREGTKDENCRRTLQAN